MKKSWIKLSATVLINLNFIIKIVRISDAAEGIIVFHSSSGTGASQRVNYASSAIADAKFTEIIALLDSQTAYTDISA